MMLRIEGKIILDMSTKLRLAVHANLGHQINLIVTIYTDLIAMATTVGIQWLLFQHNAKLVQGAFRINPGATQPGNPTPPREE